MYPPHCQERENLVTDIFEFNPRKNCVTDVDRDKKFLTQKQGCGSGSAFIFPPDSSYKYRKSEFAKAPLFPTLEQSFMCVF